MVDLVTLTTELLLIALFAGAVVSAVRTRDPVARDVALVFGAFAPASLLGILGDVIGRPPVAVSLAIVALLFAQPVLVLRLVARLRDVPRWLVPGSAALVAVSLLPLVAVLLGAPAFLAFF